MSGHDLVVPAANLSGVAPRALADAARRCGVDGSNPQLIRLFATAVYQLPAAGAVARIALVTSPQSVERLATSVRVTRWLSRDRVPGRRTAPRRPAGRQPRVRGHVLALSAAARPGARARPTWGICCAACMASARPRPAAGLPADGLGQPGDPATARPSPTRSAPG